MHLPIKLLNAGSRPTIKRLALNLSPLKFAAPHAPAWGAAFWRPAPRKPQCPCKPCMAWVPLKGYPRITWFWIFILTYPGLCKSGFCIPSYPGICKSRNLIPTYPGLSQSTKPILGYPWLSWLAQGVAFPDAPVASESSTNNIFELIWAWSSSETHLKSCQGPFLKIT